jgi:hypothetical protein
MSYATFHLAQKNSTTLLDLARLAALSEKTLQMFFKHFATMDVRIYTSTPRQAVYDSYQGPVRARFEGKITQPVKILTLNETTTWLSLTIIIILILIFAVLIVARQIVYPSSSMQHPVECLADVLVMVAGSEEFVEVVRESRISHKEMRTKLGWFRDRREMVRWRIEVVGGEVDWVDGSEGEEKVMEEKRDGKEVCARIVGRLSRRA